MKDGVNRAVKNRKVEEKVAVDPAEETVVAHQVVETAAGTSSSQLRAEAVEQLTGFVNQGTLNFDAWIRSWRISARSRQRQLRRWSGCEDFVDR